MGIKLISRSTFADSSPSSTARTHPCPGITHPFRTYVHTMSIRFILFTLQQRPHCSIALFASHTPRGTKSSSFTFVLARGVPSSLVRRPGFLQGQNNYKSLSAAGRYQLSIELQQADTTDSPCSIGCRPTHSLY